MSAVTMNILLADDDADDCYFFCETLRQVNLPARLTTVPDGERLMQLLTDELQELPHVLFLDLNMPRKNGFECLADIRGNKRLDSLSIVIFSTSFEQDVVNQLYDDGAHFFMRKPADFDQFKHLITKTLTLIVDANGLQPQRQNFVITL